MIAPEAVVDAALDALPATADHACARCSTPPACCCTPTSAGRRCPPRPVDALAVAAGHHATSSSTSPPARAGRAGPGALGALLAAVPDAGGRRTSSTTAPPRSRWSRAALAARAARSSSPAASWSRSATGSASPSCSSPPAPGCARSARPTASRLADYAAAVGPDTAFVLKVHPSNFVVTRLHLAPSPVDELAGLGVPVVADIGSGLLAPAPAAARRARRRDARCARAPTLVTASGDKLLGGPQAGLLLGAPALVPSGAAAAHPLARALRVDKLTLAALEATLRGPAPPDRGGARRRPGRRCARRADAAGRRARPSTGRRGRVDSAAAVGGGGAPGVELPSAAVALPERFAAALRAGEPRGARPRSSSGRCLLDLRAVPRPTTTPLADAVARPRGSRADARRRHRRARRPRQVHPGPGAHRDGARPAGPRSAAAA